MKSLLWMVILLAVWGCSSDGTTTYRPHFTQDDAAKPAPAPAAQAAPKDAGTSAAKAKIVEKVGDVDYAAYGIPIYPGAEVKPDASVAFRSQQDGPKDVQVTMESIDGVPDIAVWYRDQIKAVHALSSADLGTLQGTTETGYPVRISIAKVDTKSVILVTVSETPKK